MKIYLTRPFEIIRLTEIFYNRTCSTNASNIEINETFQVYVDLSILNKD